MICRTETVIANLSASPSNPQLDIACFRGDQLIIPVSVFDGPDVADLSNVSTITLIVKEQADSTVPLMEQVVNTFENNNLTFEFTSEECNLTEALNTENVFPAYLYAIKTNNEKVTLAVGTLTMQWDGNPLDLGPAPTPPDLNITFAQADARYVRYDTATSYNNTQKATARTNINALAVDGDGGQLTNLQDTAITFSDVTTGNSSTLKHGFLPKLSGNSSQVFKGDGTWGAGGGGSGDVSGPGSSTNNSLARWDGTSGTLLKDGLLTSVGGNGAADSGKVLLFESNGNIHASNNARVAAGGGHGGALILDAVTSPHQVKVWPASNVSATRTQELIDRDGSLQLIDSFNPKDYGAVGDARKVTDAVTTNGSPTITSATAAFTAADTGKKVWVNNSASHANVAIGTATYVNSTTITCSANASASITGGQLVIGTNDDAAFTACQTAALAVSPSAQIVIPAGGYIIGSRILNNGNNTSVSILGSGSETCKLYMPPDYSHAASDGDVIQGGSSLIGFTIDGLYYNFNPGSANKVVSNGKICSDVKITGVYGYSVQFYTSIANSYYLCSAAAGSTYGFYCVNSSTWIDCYAGNQGAYSVGWINTSGCRWFGGVIDESITSGLQVSNSADCAVIGATIYGYDSGYATVLESTAKCRFDDCIIEYYTGRTNSGGLKVNSGCTAYVANSRLKGTGTAFALLNSGTCYDGDNIVLEGTGLSGTLTYGGISNIPVTVLNSGTGASSSTFWRGDGTWAAAGTGSVTSVAMTVPSFLSVSGSPITTSGTLAVSLSGTALPVANGGTGQTTANAAFNALAPSQTTNSGKFLTTNGIDTSWASVATGTVTSVGASFTGGLISVGGTPITSAGTLALTVAGTSGGIPYFSSASTWASSSALAANAIVIGGGAGSAPSTTTTGTGVLTAIGNAVDGASGLLTYNIIGTSGTKLGLLNTANTWSAAQTNSTAVAASTPPAYFTGALYTGGTGTTTFPAIFHQPTGASAATTWSSGANSGTVFGCNEATGFVGSFFDLRIAGTKYLRSYTDGNYSFLEWNTPSNGQTGSVYFNSGVFNFKHSSSSARILVAGDAGNYHIGATNDAGSTIYFLLYGEAANTAAFKNGTNAQTLRIYGTTTGSKYLNLTHDGTNAILSASSGNMNIQGNVALDKTVTAGGTTGAQTINKTTGSVNFAAAATSLVVTNSLCTTSSIIIATVATNDATMKGVQVVAGSGSFTIYPNAAPTAETRVNFILTN